MTAPSTSASRRRVDIPHLHTTKEQIEMIDAAEREFEESAKRASAKSPPTSFRRPKRRWHRGGRQSRRRVLRRPRQPTFVDTFYFKLDAPTNPIGA